MVRTLGPWTPCSAHRVLAGASRAEWEGDTWRITTRLATDNDDVSTALARFDEDPGPFLGFMRDYLRLTEFEETTP